MLRINDDHHDIVDMLLSMK